MRLLLTATLLTLLAGCAGYPEIRHRADLPLSAPSDILPATASANSTAIVTPVVDLWSIQTSALANQPPTVDPAMLPDLWARIRAGFALDDLDTPAVEQFAQSFARSNWLERLGPRARLYLYYLVIEAEKRHLPSELALLPIIESGLNPQAHSSANAVGLCQFIPQTGKRFGLHQSAFSDKRKDLSCVLSMFEYLEANAALFDGDWHLALASYNWGEGAVARAVARNKRNGLPANYLALRMPGETRGYVPQLLAIKRLIADPARYGINLPPLENRPTIACDVPLSRDIDVDQAARLAGISLADFRALNSGVRKSVIPQATHPTICLPFESAVRFAVNASEHKGPLATWTTHTVSSRTTLITLAKRYRTTPEIIRSANEIGQGMRLKAGATVLVPRARADGDIPLRVAMSATTAIEPDVPDRRIVTVKVKRKDTLSLIAKRHRVTIQAMRHWNPAVREPLKAGQKLVLYLPVKQKREGREQTIRAEASTKARQSS